MELKYWPIVLPLPSFASSNRTFMELKSRNGKESEDNHDSSNRTFMELKLSGTAWYMHIRMF